MDKENFAEEQPPTPQVFAVSNDDVKPWDLLNPNTVFVDSASQKARFEICRTCPEFLAITTQCKKCGCFMKLKTKLEKATCPIGKW
jgi:hypothetical protein